MKKIKKQQEKNSKTEFIKVNIMLADPCKYCEHGLMDSLPDRISVRIKFGRKKKNLLLCDEQGLGKIMIRNIPVETECAGRDIKILVACPNMVKAMRQKKLPLNYDRSVAVEKRNKCVDALVKWLDMADCGIPEIAVTSTMFYATAALKELYGEPCLYVLFFSIILMFALIEFYKLFNLTENNMIYKLLILILLLLAIAVMTLLVLH